MEKLKKIAMALLFPSVIIFVLLVPLSIALLIYAFVDTGAPEIVKYISYFLSAYTLTIVLARAPKIIAFIKRIKNENKLIQRYLNDIKFRMKVSLYGTFVANVLFGIIQLITGFFFESLWFYALAFYYATLAFMRFFILRKFLRRESVDDKTWEYKNYRLSGIFLLVLSSALLGIVIYMVFYNRGFSYHYIYTIALALYTFILVSIAIVNVIKYKKYQSPVMSASKAINLASALVSLLTLESAMLSAFGTGQEEFNSLMVTITGIVVLAFIIAMAVYMIINSTKKIKINKTQTNSNQIINNQMLK